MNQLLEFMKTTNPNQAKAQIEQMVNSGQLDQAQLNSLMQQAKSIGNMLGIK